MAASQANNGIKLGLSRMLKLFPPRNIGFNALHVAGTNGKGTVCFYASQMLRAKGLLVGRFNSPHLIDRWDCINIDGVPVDEGTFKHVEKHYVLKNEREQIGASKFEILAATAFDLFNMHKVDVGVVEVGVGGREDATNILPQERVLCSVITNISLDHQSLLGNSLVEIANQKAGIIRRGVPVVFDGGSGDEVTALIQETTRTVTDTPPEWRPEHLIRNPTKMPELLHQHFGEPFFPVTIEAEWRKRLLRKVQIQGPFGDYFVPKDSAKSIALAARAAQVSLLRLKKPSTRLEDFVKSVNGRQWPGRMQSLSLQPLVNRANPVLLDGAHNANSAWRLGKFVAHRFRKSWPGTGLLRPVTWVIAASAGKDVKAMFEHLFCTPGDTVIATAFGPVDGMPWVEPAPPEELLRIAQEVQELSPQSTIAANAQEAIKLAAAAAEEGPLIIAGSLYLVSDVLRSLRDTGGTNKHWWAKWEEPVAWNKELGDRLAPAGWREPLVA